MPAIKVCYHIASLDISEQDREHAQPPVVMLITSSFSFPSHRTSVMRRPVHSRIMRNAKDDER